MNTIRGGAHRVLQKQAVRETGWTKKKRTEFLAQLLVTCNVQASCRAIGLSKRGAYHLRQANAEFAQLWDEVLEQGYGRLEAELLARAMGNQHDPDNPAGLGEINAGATAPAAPFDEDLALRLLTWRSRGRVGAARAKPIERDTATGAAAEIEKRLAALEKRLARKV